VTAVKKVRKDVSTLLQEVKNYKDFGPYHEFVRLPSDGLVKSLVYTPNDIVEEMQLEKKEIKRQRDELLLETQRYKEELQKCYVRIKGLEKHFEDWYPVVQNMMKMSGGELLVIHVMI